MRSSLSRRSDLSREIGRESNISESPDEGMKIILCRWVHLGISRMIRFSAEVIPFYRNGKKSHRQILF